MVLSEWSKEKRKFCATAGVLVMLMGMLSACAVKPKMKAEHYPACYEPLQYLDESSNAIIGDTAGGAAIGALLGALVGFVASGGSAKGAIVGGVTGAVSGGLIGYAQAKQEQIAEDNARYASYSNDMRLDIYNADRTIVFASQAKACYEKAFDVLLDDIRNGRVSKAEAQARFEEIQTGMALVSDALGQVQATYDNKSQLYQAALEDEAKRQNVTVEDLAGPETSDAGAAGGNAQASADTKAAPMSGKINKPAKTEKAPAAKAEAKAEEGQEAEEPAAEPEKVMPVKPSAVPAENASLAMMKTDLETVNVKKQEIAEAKQGVDTRMQSMTAEFNTSLDSSS